ncbi:MAG: DNA polymerase III subunit delta [Firmicutes bacterium]|nr:DNA polymerase III subunit delta [Bacillota bacterium]
MRESSLSILKKLRNEIATQTARAYLIVSEQSLLLEQAIQTVIAAWLGKDYDQLQIINLNSSELTPDYFLSNVLTFGIFAQRRLALLRAADELNGDALNTVAEAIDQIPEETLLLCTVEGKKPPKGKLTTAIKKAGVILELPQLRGADLYQWTREEAAGLGLTLSPEVEAELVATFGGNLFQLQSELLKLATFVGEEKRQVEIKDLKEVMGRSSLHSIFDLTDALGQKNLVKARAELNQLLRSGENPMYVLTMLQWHLANLWQCKSTAGANPQQVAAVLGIHPYVASKSLKQAANFDLEELSRAYLLAVETEYRLKTGKAPRMDVELDRLLVKTIANC